MCTALQPAERLSDLLGLADIHLLPQRADTADLVMELLACVGGVEGRLPVRGGSLRARRGKPVF